MQYNLYADFINKFHTSIPEIQGMIIVAIVLCVLIICWLINSLFKNLFFAIWVHSQKKCTPVINNHIDKLSLDDEIPYRTNYNVGVKEGGSTYKS